jgi:O-antigen ligase
MNYGWQRDTGGFENVSQDFTFQQRISTIKAGIAMFLDRPLTGVGIDCSIFAYPVYAPGDLYFRGALITHNTIVQALSETGLLGFIPYVLFHLTGLSRARAVRLAAGDTGKSEIVHLAGGLGIGLVGFAVCGLSGGYVMSWFPYLFVGLLSRAYAIHV